MLRFLLDEHLRGPLWRAIVRHNARGGLLIDAVCVGDSPDLPLGSPDKAILLWSEREDRILVTEDVHTMAFYLAEHRQAGHHSPGVFMVGAGSSIKELVGHLELVAHAGNSSDYADTIVYVP